MATILPNVLTLPADDKAELYNLLTEFTEVTNRLAADVARQRDIRLYIVAKYFARSPEGTATLPLEFGKALKAGINITRTVNKTALDEFNKTNTSNSLKAALDDLLTYDPKVSVTKWKALDPETKLALADIVIEKDGLPTLEIATPKR